MPDLEQIRRRFQQDSYACQVTGVVIEEAGPGYARCSLKVEPKHRNAVGQVMGGVLFTLADFAFAVAANNDGTLTVTAVSQISFLSKVQGDALTAECKLLRDGHRSCFYDTAIRDGTGNLVAVVSSTGRHIQHVQEEKE